MKRFKLPIIVTAAAFAVAVIVVIAGATMIHSSGATNRQKAERAGKLGGGTAALTCFVVAPFWLFAAAKYGKEKREAKERKRQVRTRKRTS